MPKRSAFDWLLEGISLVALAAMFWTVADHWGELPARVPTHFNASGRPDGWGGKNTVLILLAINAGSYLLMTVAARYQSLISIPFRIDRTAPEVQQILLRMTVVTKTALMVLLTWLIYTQLEVATGRAVGLGRLFLPVFLAGVLGPAGLFMIRLWKYRSTSI